VANVNKKNKIALEQAEMRMITWMCGVRLRDRSSCMALKQRLEVKGIGSVVNKID